MGNAPGIDRPTPSALDIADRLIKLSFDEGVPITPLQVQKLTYFAHGWFMGFGYGKLFNESIEAWQYGPVVPSVYHALKHFGRQRITSRLYEDGKYTLSEEAERIVGLTWKAYGKFDGIRLSKITHDGNGPWAAVMREGLRGQQIPNEIIQGYFEDLASRAEAKTQSKEG